MQRKLAGGKAGAAAHSGGFRGATATATYASSASGSCI